MIKYLIWSLGFALSGSVLPVIADDDPRTIRVSGFHQQMVAADGYEIEIKLLVRDTQRNVLQTELQNKRKQLNKLVGQFKLNKEQYGYTQSDLREEFQWHDGKRTFVGYSMQESWWIEVKGNQQNAEILAYLGSLSAVDSYQSQPKSASQTAYRQALRYALQDAKAKAQNMAQELGTCLDKPLKIDEVSGGLSRPEPRRLKAMAMMESSAQPEAKVSNQAKVEVIWSLEKCDS